MRIYLSQKIREAKEFQAFPRSERGQMWEECRFAGDNLFCDNGFFYIDLGHQGIVSRELIEYIEEVSLQETFSHTPRRVVGIYKYNSAIAQLDLSRYEREPRYEVHIAGKTIEDVQSLYQKIRGGTILPVESWEAPQIPGPREGCQETEAKDAKSGKKSLLRLLRGLIKK